MEFLKELFGDGSLTYAELETKLKDNNKIKLVNLADGQYVDKSKLVVATNDLTIANKTIKDLQETVKKFDGVDVDGLKKEARDWETKYNNDLATAKREYAIKAKAESLKFTSEAAKKMFVADALAKDLKLDGDTVLGFDDFVKGYKETDAGAFVSEDQGNQGNQGAHVSTGGQHGDNGGNNGPATLADAIKMKLSTQMKTE